MDQDGSMDFSRKKNWENLAFANGESIRSKYRRKAHWSRQYLTGDAI